MSSPRCWNPQQTFEAFLSTLSDPLPLAALFDHLPHVYFFVKNARSEFMRMNQASLAMHGCRSLSEIVGKTDFDFHPPALASQYIEEDRRVIASSKPLVDQVWLVMSHDGMPRWYLCTKLPLNGHHGEPAGIAGTMRLYDYAGPSPRDYRRLTPVMEFVLDRFGEPIQTAQLAAAANLSISQLQREFRRLFRMSPSEYVLRVRLLVARRRLEETNDPVGVIALDCGFYDQSHFTRAFTQSNGIAPLAYRARYLRHAGEAPPDSEDHGAGTEKNS